MDVLPEKTYSSEYLYSKKALKTSGKERCNTLFMTAEELIKHLLKPKKVRVNKTSTLEKL